MQEETREKGGLLTHLPNYIQRLMESTAPTHTHTHTEHICKTGFINGCLVCTVGVEVRSHTSHLQPDGTRGLHKAPGEEFSDEWGELN